MTPRLQTINQYMRALLYLCMSIGLIGIGVFIQKNFLTVTPVLTDASMPAFATNYHDGISCAYHMNRCESLPGLATYYAWTHGFIFSFPDDITLTPTTLTNDELLSLTYHCPETIPCGTTQLFVDTITNETLSEKTIERLYIGNNHTILERTPFFIDGRPAQRLFVLEEHTLVPDTIIQVLNGPHIISFISKGSCGTRNCLSRARELSEVFLSSFSF